MPGNIFNGAPEQVWSIMKRSSRKVRRQIRRHHEQLVLHGKVNSWYRCVTVVQVRDGLNFMHLRGSIRIDQSPPRRSNSDRAYIHHSSFLLPHCSFIDHCSLLTHSSATALGSPLLL